MEQKDKTAPSEAPLKKLASAQDLRGSTSGSGPEGGGKKRHGQVPAAKARRFHKVMDSRRDKGADCPYSG